MDTWKYKKTQAGEKPAVESFIFMEFGQWPHPSLTRIPGKIPRAIETWDAMFSF